MKKRLILSITAAILIAAAGTAAWLANKNTNNKPASTTKTTTAKTTTTPTKKTNSNMPTGMSASIHHWDQAGFLNASYTRKLTDFTPWQESPVSVEYRDFNNDSVDDAFVWAKIPGTKGYSFAAVWTMDSDGQPKELWYLPSNLFIPQSDWSITSDETLTNTGKNEDNSPLVHNFHWQVTTTGSGFVLEPSAS